MGWRSGRFWAVGSWKPELGTHGEGGSQVWGPLLVDTYLGSLGIQFKIFPVACRVASWSLEGVPAQHYLGLAFLGKPHPGTALCLVCPPSLLVLRVSGNLQTSKAADWLRFGKSGCCCQTCTKVCVWSEHLR